MLAKLDLAKKKYTETKETKSFGALRKLKETRKEEIA